MTTGAIHSLITADNSDFRSALAAVEGDTSRAMGRVGAVVKTSARGYRDLSGAILGTVGVVGLVGGAAGAAANVVMDLLDTQKRVNDEVRQERIERDKVLESARATRRELETRFGLRDATPNRDSLQSGLDRMIAERDKMQADADAKRASIRGLAAFGGGTGLSSIAEWWDGTETKARQAEAGVAGLNEEIGRMIALIKRANDLDEQALIKARQGRVRDLRGASESDRIAILKLEGRETAALREEENQRFRDALEHITQLEAASGASFERERDQAQERHNKEMDRIGREAAARARAQDLSNELSGKELDAQEAALRGDKDRAKALEEEIRLRREIEAIRNTGGLDAAEKQRRIEQAGRISALRLAGDSEIRRTVVSATLEAGVQRNGSTMRQVFGGTGAFDVQKSINDTTKKQLTATEAIKGYMDTIMRSGLKTEAVFV